MNEKGALLIAAVLTIGCEQKQPRPQTCAEQSVYIYEVCMGKIGTRNAGCQVMAEHWLEECKEKRHEETSGQEEAAPRRGESASGRVQQAQQRPEAGTAERWRLRGTPAEKATWKL